MIRKFFFALALALLCFSGSAFATTYYISAAGSDTLNNGQTKAGAWLHAPGMPNCAGSAAGTCGGYTPQPGDSFIFRGGDTWHFGNPSLSPFVGGSCVGNTGTGGYVCWNWQWSGTSANPIYIGVDQTWYVGASWVRPVLSGDNPLWTGSGYPASCAYNFAADPTDSAEVQFVQINQSYVTFDNFEFTGMCYSGNPNNIAYLAEEGGVATNDTVSNLYCHGWTRTAAAGEENYCISTIGGGTLLDHNQYVGLVIDGSDSPHWPPGTSSANCPSTEGVNGCATGGGIYGRASTLSRSVMRYLSNAVVASEVCTWRENLIEYIYNSPIPGAQHSNFLNNDNTNGCSTMSIYDNVFRHGFANEAFYLTPSSTLYFFNNVIYDMMNGSDGSSPFLNPAGCVYLIGPNPPNTQANAYFYNNTFGDASCQISPGLTDGSGTSYFYGNLFWENNHFIGYTTDSLSPASCSGGALCPLNTSACTGSCTIQASTDNGGEFWQTASAASAAGYVSANSFQPTATGGTLTGGNNLTSSCSAFSGDSALCSGTSLGVSEQSGSGGLVAAYPALPVVARPSTGTANWYPDAFASAITGAALAPTCTPASGSPPQTVTCTNPNSGTTVMCGAVSPTTPATAGDGVHCSAGTVISGPINVTVPETLEVIAGTSTLSDSTISSYTYLAQVATPTFSPGGGSYSGTQTVTISTSTIGGAAICYTTNGVTPQAATPGTCSVGTMLANHGTISVAVSETVNALATLSGDANSAVAAAAYTIGTPTDTLAVTVSGAGTVASSPLGIACPPTCSSGFPPGTVALTASPTTNYSFSGWGGACSGSTTICNVNLMSSQSVTAAFSPNALNQFTGGVRIGGSGITIGGGETNLLGYGNGNYGVGPYSHSGVNGGGVKIGQLQTIPAAFFGLQLNNPTTLGANLPIPGDFNYGTIRFWDLANQVEMPFLATSGSAWPLPTTATFSWGDDATTGFDYWMRFAKTNNLEVVLNMARTPDFLSEYGSRCTAAGVPDPSCAGPADFTCAYSGTSPTPPAGECWPNVDLNADGTGTDATFQLLTSTVATHLAGLNASSHVTAAIIEPWNEFNIGGQWSGTEAQMETLNIDAANSFLNANPHNLITTANSTEWNYPLVTGVSSYQGRLMGNSTIAGLVSLLSIHGYMAMNGSTGQFPCYPGPAPACQQGVAPPEELVNLVANVRRNVPTWPEYGILMSELSWIQANTSFCDPDMRKAWVGREYLIGWAVGIYSMDWYHYDDEHNCSAALATPTSGGDAACIAFGGPSVPGTTGWVECPAGVAYQQLYGWMVGNIMDQKCSGPFPPDTTTGTNWGLWTCHFINSDGTQALAVWDTDPAYTCASGTCPTTTQFTFQGPYTKFYTLDNSTSTAISGGCSSGCTPAVGAKPILLHN